MSQHPCSTAAPKRWPCPSPSAQRRRQMQLPAGSASAAGCGCTPSGCAELSLLDPAHQSGHAPPEVCCAADQSTPSCFRSRRWRQPHSSGCAKMIVAVHQSTPSCFSSCRWGQPTPLAPPNWHSRPIRARPPASAPAAPPCAPTSPSWCPAWSSGPGPAAAPGRSACRHTCGEVTSESMPCKHSEVASNTSQAAATRALTRCKQQHCIIGQSRRCQRATKASADETHS